MATAAATALMATVAQSSLVTAGGFALFSAASLKYFLVSTAIGAAINALMPKPTTPGAAGYTVTARGSNLDHQIIYGQTRVAGAVVADFLSGDGGREGTRHLHRVQVMAGHEIESYEEIYMNSHKVSKWRVRGAGPSGDQTIDNVTDITPYVDQPFNILVPVEFVDVAPDGTETVVDGLSYRKWSGLAMQFWTGADDQTASTKLIADIPNSKWTSDHRLRGRAYMYIRMGRDADGDNFPTGVPEITAVIKGRKVYDPREVSHDPDDKSTWAWSDNPALCIRDYLTQDFGLGEKDIQVDDDLVETAANVCDQTADDGSTRYTCNGAFTTGIQPYDLLNSILTSMGGLLWYAQGQWRMKPAYWTAPTESFSEDDFRSAISVSTRHSRKDNFNTVEGTFRGPKSNYALTTFPAVDSAASITADGGTVSKIDLEMPFTDTPEEARRIARIVLERNRQQLTVRASFGLKAFRVQVGDVISLSLERFGWVNKTFEVTEWSFGNVDQYDIQIELTLREITENVFDEVDDGVTFELDNANVPSPLAGLVVTNLIATPSGVVTPDSVYTNNLLVDWNGILNSNVAEYTIEWRVDTFDYASNGGVAELPTSPTTRELFIFAAYAELLYRQPDQDGFDFYSTGGGSSLTEQQIRDQLAASAEGVAAASYVFNGAKVNGTATEYVISPVLDSTFYSVRVRATNDFGASSQWAASTVDSGPRGPFNADNIKLGAATSRTLTFDIDADGNLAVLEKGISPDRLGSLSLSSSGLVTGAGLASSDTGGFANSVLKSSHGLSDGDQIVFVTVAGSPVTIGSIEIGRPYYVVNSTTSTFQISATLGGSAIDILTAENDTVNFRTEYTTLSGVHINTEYFGNGLYIYQDAPDTYSAFFKSLFSGGGATQFSSPGGFTCQVINTSNGSGAFGPYCAVDAQTTDTSGGKVRLGVSGTDGGWAVEAYSGGIYGAVTAPFTGAHEGMLLKTADCDVGDILVDGSMLVVKIDDSFGEVHRSTQANQNCPVGVLSKIRDQWHTPIAFVDQEATAALYDEFTPTKLNPSPGQVTTHSADDYKDAYRLVSFNAIGEGAINVCGEGGNISKGDLIVTSSTPGKGMKQVDDIVRSYTVAKAREDVTFSGPDDIKTVACIYLCG